MTPNRRLLPWYKNEKIPGTGLTNARSLRLFITAVVLFAVAVVAMAFYLIGVGQKTDRTARTARQVADKNHALVARLDDLLRQFKATQDSNHALRLADQRRTEAQIRQVYCLLVSQTPDDPARPIIGQIRELYGCGPFNPADVGHLTPGQVKILNQAVPPSPAPKASNLTSPSHAPTKPPPSPHPTSTPTTRPTTPAPATSPLVQLCPTPLLPLPCITL
jgi:hypothetical protein